jgi:hypothetical protein
MTYDLITISISIIIAYLASWMLYKEGYIKSSFHNRLWNILILVTFFVSAIFGVILIALGEIGLALPISQPLLYWHVQFAIAMFIVTIFHFQIYWKSFIRLTFGRRFFK